MYKNTDINVQKIYSNGIEPAPFDEDGVLFELFSTEKHFTDYCNRLRVEKEKLRL